MSDDKTGEGESRATARAKPEERTEAPAVERVLARATKQAIPAQEAIAQAVRQTASVQAAIARLTKQAMPGWVAIAQAVRQTASVQEAIARAIKQTMPEQEAIAQVVRQTASIQEAITRTKQAMPDLKAISEAVRQTASVQKTFAQAMKQTMSEQEAIAQAVRQTASVQDAFARAIKEATPAQEALAQAAKRMRLERDVLDSPMGVSNDYAGAAAQIAEQRRMRRLEIERLRAELAEESRQSFERARAATAEELKERDGKIAELEQKERFASVIDNVCAAGQARLLADQSFADKFKPGSTHPAFVMSVDIRRSTELMLKARAPEQFAAFITTLCERLAAVVLDNLGYFDKFTGDGILALFPVFYSGRDAGPRAVATAAQSHVIFADTYREFRTAFVAVPAAAGLGIGIDFGPVTLVQVARGLTAVGAPVVYACRLSGVEAGKTLVNQPAVEQLEKNSPDALTLTEREFDVKHEGPIVTHEVRLSGEKHEFEPPDWLVAVEPMKEDQ